jgi:hypothetical protein
MQNQNPHLLALPVRSSVAPASLLKIPPEVFAMRIERPLGRRKLRAASAMDHTGKPITPRSLPRSIKRFPARGFIPGRYGWPRASYIAGFADWTIYGHPEPHSDTRSDHFIATQDFIAHAQKLPDASLVIRHIATSRYGTPIYRMQPDMEILPIYLRQPISPPTSAHGRMEQMARFGPQLAAILRLLDIPAGSAPELTWLPAENYAF